MPVRVKMPHCWKFHVAAHILKTEEMAGDSLNTMLRIRRENVVVTKEIKLIEIEKRYCKRRKFNKKKYNSLFNSHNKNVEYGIGTNNAELKNISVQYSCVLPTEPPRQLIAN